jgi:hypothetical protein
MDATVKYTAPNNLQFLKLPCLFISRKTCRLAVRRTLGKLVCHAEHFCGSVPAYGQASGQRSADDPAQVENIVGGPSVTRWRQLGG